MSVKNTPKTNIAGDVVIIKSLSNYLAKPVHSSQNQLPNLGPLGTGARSGGISSRSALLPPSAANCREARSAQINKSLSATQAGLIVRHH